MRYAALALAILCVALSSSASADDQGVRRPPGENVLPEPSILKTPGDHRSWPLNVEPQQDTTPGGAGDQSALVLCAANRDRWPDELRTECDQLLTAAIKAERSRLDALALTYADVAHNRAKFTEEHTQATLEDQRRQGAYLFWLVVVVVVVGMVAAVAQFAHSLRATDAGGSAELAVSNNELKFKTTWLGALLLGMSMGFLALYLFVVYPVTVVGA